MSSKKDQKKRGRSSSIVQEEDVEMVKVEEVGRGEQETNENSEEDMDEFEDPFEDEYEEEEVIQPKHNEEDDEDWEDVDAEEEEDEEEESNVPTSVWNPSERPLEEGEELDWDSQSYQLFHILRSELPCLSFDILLDKLGYQRTKYPQTMYFVAGSQQVDSIGSKIFIMKASQLMKTQYDSEDEDDIDDDEEGEEEEEEEQEKEGKNNLKKSDKKKKKEEDEDNLDDDPELEHFSFKFRGSVNRIRSMGQCPWIISAWSDQGYVSVYDINHYIKLLENENSIAYSSNQSQVNELVHWNNPNRSEGFALDWSPLKPGMMVCGDCFKNIYVWEANDNFNSWNIRSKPFSSHSASVEDLQWSPTEQTVFASCSVDKTIKIWDTRDSSGKCQLSVVGATEDINVLSWNPNVAYLLLSGSDDSSFSIWDLRTFTSGKAAAHFKWHKGAITSVEWNPNDDSELAVASDDNSISVWDMSLEKDDESDINEGEIELPPQLLFIHHGQTEIKEVHWHPQIPGMLSSTAANGFNVFKPDITSSPVSAK